MISLTTYICLVVGFLLFAANGLVFYAVLKKRRPSTVDILIGALCLHSMAYFIAYTITLLIKKLTHLSHLTMFAGECVDCYFAFALPIILSVFFIDRYLATSRPLFYKMKVMNRHAYIPLTISVALSTILTVFTMANKEFIMGSATVHFSYFLCISIVAVASFIVMVICYVSICRSLLYFAGRQMFIFGNEALFRATLPAVVENTNVESTEQLDLETNISTDIIEAERQIEIPKPDKQQQAIQKEKLCKKKSSLPAVLHKKSVNSLGDHNREFLAARAARYSCPIYVESKYQPDLPLWLIASLSNELAESHHQGLRQRSQTLPIDLKDDQTQQAEPRRNRACTVDELSTNKDFGRFPRRYTICNVVVNLIVTRRKREADRGLRLSQARNLVQILTTKLVFYLLWLPFLIYSLLLETQGSGNEQRRINTSLVWDMLRIALHIHMLSPTIYAFACHPYRVTLGRCWTRSFRMMWRSREATV